MGQANSAVSESNIRASRTHMHFGLWGPQNHFEKIYFHLKHIGTLAKSESKTIRSASDVRTFMGFKTECRMEK